MIPTINDLPDWERTLLRQVREAQASEGQLYRELADKFHAAQRKAASSREAVAITVDHIYAFACSILASPANHSARALDLATGLVNELTTYTTAELAKSPEENNGSARR